MILECTLSFKNQESEGGGWGWEGVTWGHKKISHITLRFQQTKTGPQDFNSSTMVKNFLFVPI